MLGQGYAKGAGPLVNASQEVLDLAKLINHMWISFIHSLDPNEHGSKFSKPIYIIMLLKLTLNS